MLTIFGDAFLTDQSGIGRNGNDNLAFEVHYQRLRCVDHSLVRVNGDLSGVGYGSVFRIHLRRHY